MEPSVRESEQSAGGDGVRALVQRCGEFLDASGFRFGVRVQEQCVGSSRRGQTLIVRNAEPAIGRISNEKGVRTAGGCYFRRAILGGVIDYNSLDVGWQGREAFLDFFPAIVCYDYDGNGGQLALKYPEL